MTDVNVLVLVGSLRAASVNRKLAEVAVGAAPDGARLVVHSELGDLPFYNEDLDTDTPPGPVAELRSAAARAGAVLVVTPEYNGTIPAVLKNAIDWLSRPYGSSAVAGKPVAVIGAAQGRYGGTWAHDEARKSFGIAGARAVEDIRFSLPIADLDGSDPADSPRAREAVRRAVVDLVAAAR
ncbi:MAG: NAD(P)H-dependent oxidoreductase [Mycobacterium sp.]|nr:NAD(P)H-dependent oxidoreductase [Mycobacterium sp.]